MLSFDTILIPLLGGFLFVKYCYFTRFRAVRDNGYVILFKSAIFGLFFYGIAFFIWRIIMIDENANPLIPEWLDYFHQFLRNPELAPALFSLVLIGFALAALNYVLDEDEMKKRVIKQDDDSIEITILKSYDDKIDVLVTLDNGKIYVGKVTDTYFRINDEIQSILLNPVASGYRNSEDHTIQFTTYYGLIYKQIIDNPDEFNVKISDFSVAIRYDHLISVSPFDLKTYAKFKVLHDQG